ncbi:venom allergen 3 homolog [Osmia bicornis bicornis]|uniref:venom allergen 3 homolog n=1 Tax=Osmia bicornis bicornis TaxID=1437191 RepID=UPI001EAF4CEA|nr:venom allergen 3 homolog [Osmia bicornis bicornis]
MKRFLGIVIAIAFAVTTSSAVNCTNNICLASGTQHTMCKYTNSNASVACGQVQSMGFSDIERREILDAINMQRSRVAQGRETKGNPGPQPPASNMQVLFWDSELAEIAQRWANQCNYAYDTCRHVDRFLVGQTVYSESRYASVSTTLSQVVASWYNQVQRMDRKQVPRLTSTNGVSDYTQLVWAKTNRLGCGKIKYKIGSSMYLYVVCNYGPSGNFLTDPVYEI